MQDRYDNRRFVDNVSEIRRRLKVNIGTFEKTIGVSHGYISRLSNKPRDSALSIDVASKISCYKGSGHILLDVILAAKMVPLANSEMVIKKFLRKLLDRTRQGTIKWKVDAAESLNVLNPDLYGVAHVLEKEALDENEFETGAYFYAPIIGKLGDSKSCDVCIHTNIDETNEIYIAKIKHIDTQEIDYELHMVANGEDESKPVYSTRQRNEELSVMLRMVYQVGKLSLTNASIPSEARDFILNYVRAREERNK